MVLTVSFALFPVIGLFVTVIGGILPADLTPASRRQNHTTPPSASVLFVKSTSVSTASRPASVTIASAPLVGRDGEAYEVIWRHARTEMFLRAGLDGPNQVDPAQEITVSKTSE